MAMKPGKEGGPYEVCAEIKSYSGKMGISVMMERCQRVLDGKGKPDKWQTNPLTQFSKEK